MSTHRHSRTCGIMRVSLRWWCNGLEQRGGTNWLSYLKSYCFGLILGNLTEFGILLLKRAVSHTEELLFSILVAVLIYYFASLLLSNILLYMAWSGGINSSWIIKRWNILMSFLIELLITVANMNNWRPLIMVDGERSDSWVGHHALDFIPFTIIFTFIISNCSLILNTYDGFQKHNS